jgi:septum formation protein
LRAAGIDPVVMVADVDEDQILADALGHDPATPPAELVQLLARAKAEALGGAAPPEALVLGCDSMLELDGELLGKPRDATDAARRIRQQAGRVGHLHTGHWLLAPTSLLSDAAEATPVPGQRSVRRGEGAASCAEIRFGEMTDAEIQAYVASGEPLAVAGAFTIDGLGGPFIDGIDGDHHGVVGLSLPVLRQLLRRLSLSVVDLWRPGVL